VLGCDHGSVVRGPVIDYEHRELGHADLVYDGPHVVSFVEGGDYY